MATSKPNPRGTAAKNMKAAADKKKQGQARNQATANRAKAQARKTAAKQISGKAKPKIEEQGVANIPGTIVRAGATVAKALLKNSKTNEQRLAAAEKSRATKAAKVSSAREKAKASAYKKQVKADQKRRSKLTPSQKTAEAKSIQSAKNSMIKAEEKYKASMTDANKKEWLRTKNAYDSLVKYRNPKFY